MQNLISEHTGIAKQGKTGGFAGTGRGFARPEAAGRACAWFWNYTNAFLRSEPRPVPYCLDPLLTLNTIRCSVECESSLIVYFCILL
jgi:hypothetical protein